jgi:hypothetical protein
MVVGAVIGGGHGRGDVPGQGVHVGSRRLGVGLGGWRRRLAGDDMVVMVLVGAVVAGAVGVVGSVHARVVGWTGRVCGAALVLQRRHGRLMGRHGAGERGLGGPESQAHGRAAGGTRGE